MPVVSNLGHNVTFSHKAVQRDLVFPFIYIYTWYENLCAVVWSFPSFQFLCVCPAV